MAKKKATQTQTQTQAEAAASTPTGNALFEEATLNQSQNNVLSKAEANRILAELEKLQSQLKQTETLLCVTQDNLIEARNNHYVSLQNIQHYTGSFFQRLAHLFQGYGSKLYSPLGSEIEPAIY